MVWELGIIGLDKCSRVTPSSPECCPKAAHLQQGLPPTVTLVSTLDGGERDTESSCIFRESWARCIYPRNGLSQMKPLATVHLGWNATAVGCTATIFSCLICNNFQLSEQGIQFSSLTLPAQQGRSKDSITLRLPYIVTWDTLCIDVILQPHSTVIRLCSGQPLNISQSWERR